MAGNGKEVQDRIPSSLVSDELLEQLKHTHEIIDRPEKFASMFCDVAATQNAVREKLVEILTTSIQHDVNARKEVKKVMKELYDEDWRKFVRSAWGKIALVLWTAISTGIGFWINHWLSTGV